MPAFAGMTNQGVDWASPSVAGWRLKPAREGSGRLGWGGLKAMPERSPAQCGWKPRLKRGGFFPHP